MALDPADWSERTRHRSGRRRAARALSSAGRTFGPILPVEPARRSRQPSVVRAGQGPLQLLHDGIRAVEGALVHAAEGVDQLTVGAVALGVAGQLVVASRVVDALERLLHLSDLERHRPSLSLGSGGSAATTRMPAPTHRPAACPTHTDEDSRAAIQILL